MAKMSCLWNFWKKWKTVKFKSIQNINSSLILSRLSTLNEKGLKPYWNMQCQELQSKLWLPHKMDSH